MGFLSGSRKSRETYPSPPNPLNAVFEIALQIMGNYQQDAAVAAGPASSVSMSAAAISPVVGVSEAINRVSASAWVTGSTSVEVAFQLFRDSTAIGPLIKVTSDATNGISAASVSWIDTPGDLAAHTYSLKMTPATGNVSIGTNDGSIAVQQQL
jgi:hypothetical protein